MDDLGRELAARLAPWISHGVSYTSAPTVYAQFKDLINALDTLGRPDLSQALESRVSLDFCAKHAAVLRVLQLCSRNITEAKIPAAYHRQPDVSGETIIREINADIPDFPMYAGGDTSDSELDRDESSSNSPYRDSEPTGSEATNRNIPDSPSDRDKLREFANEISHKYRICSEPAPLPESLTYGQIVSELALLASDQPSYQSANLIGVSPECNQSLWDQFTNISRTPITMSQSADLLSCSTIIELLATIESKNLISQPNNAREEQRQVVASWLAGNTDDWPFELSSFQRYCPSEWFSTQLYNACLYSRLARQVYHNPPAYSTLSSTGQSRWFSQQKMLRNGYHLLNCGLRDDLQTAWQQLSAVYLAQDDRILLLLDYWINEHPQINVSDLSSYLEIIWPNSPFSLTGSDPFVPTLELSIHPWLADTFGRNFGHLFYPEALEAAWLRAVDAVKRSDQSAQFDLRELALRVGSLIRTGLTVEPYYTCLS